MGCGSKKHAAVRNVYRGPRPSNSEIPLSQEYDQNGEEALASGVGSFSYS
jgi:hypothetical protein